jgi:hypothetical protein
MFQNLFKQGGRSGGASPNEFNFWRQQTQAFQDVSAYAFNVANLTGEAAPEQIQTTRASADFFRLCGADLLRGRTYTDKEDLPKAPKTVVLAYGFWRRRFGGDPQVIAVNGMGRGPHRAERRWPAPMVRRPPPGQELQVDPRVASTDLTSGIQS